MAEVKVLISQDEIKEKDELIVFIRSLSKENRLRFLGFLNGVRLMSWENKK